MKVGSEKRVGLLLSLNFSMKTIWSQFLRVHIQTAPEKVHIFLAVYLNCNWFYCKSSICIYAIYGLVQLVPKYISKVKLNRRQPPNILSEIIRPQENGGISSLEISLKDRRIVQWSKKPLLVLSREMLHKCTQYNISFSRIGQLRTHLLIHSGERIQQIIISCKFHDSQHFFNETFIVKMISCRGRSRWHHKYTSTEWHFSLASQNHPTGSWTHLFQFPTAPCLPGPLQLSHLPPTSQCCCWPTVDRKRPFVFNATSNSVTLHLWRHILSLTVEKSHKVCRM